jgi:hypothetical protein
MKLIPTFDAATSVAYLGARDNGEADTAISDLFFNYTHDNPAEHSAVTADANEFAATMEILLGHEIDRAALVADYFARL